MQRAPLSVVVITKNEQSNIAACLKSVKDWAEEIIIVDDESTDETTDIARTFTSKVLTRKMDNEGRHRNWAYRQATHDWVLSLDADEEVSKELKEEINASVLSGKEIKAWSIPLKTYIGDRWVQHGGWYPASKIRLFDKNCFKYEESEVHPCVIVEGRTGSLTKDIIHKGYPDIGHFIDSLNRQTTLEARKWVRTGTNMTKGRIIRRAVDRFFRSYIRKKGFKDGYIGFMVAYFASSYQIISYAKYRELKDNQMSV